MCIRHLFVAGIVAFLLCIGEASAKTDRAPDPGSGTGGIGITSIYNGYCAGLSVAAASSGLPASNQTSASATDQVADIIVQPEAKQPDDFRKLNADGNDVPGDCPQCTIVRGKPFKVTIIGPLLDANVSPDGSSVQECTPTGFAVTITLTQTNVGPVSNDVPLWRPKLELRSVLYQPQTTVRVTWLLRRPGGSLVDRVTILEHPQPAYPIVVEKTIQTDGTVTDGIADSEVADISKGLLLAVRSNNFAAVKSELAKGADVNQQDQESNTALMFSVMYGFFDRSIIEALLAHGAKPNARGSGGNTALMFASGLGSGGVSAEAINILLDHGADPEIRNAIGYTALMIAAESGKSDAVQALLDHHADVNAQCHDGRTALMLASSYPNGEARKAILKLLTQHGADPLGLQFDGEEEVSPELTQCQKDTECSVVAFHLCGTNSMRAINRTQLSNYHSHPEWQSFDSSDCALMGVAAPQKGIAYCDHDPGTRFGHCQTR